MDKPIEILAPAGNMEMLQAAVLAGANAVYLGLERFNARRTAGNFTIDALGQAVVFCHARNVRVYVALNTVLYPAELPSVAQTICDVAAVGADAVIVQDLAVARLVRVMVPSLALHASTQMSVHSLAGARQLADMGFARVILSRELSLAEIAHICANCAIETEVFVHGALCMSVSGQCYMSAFLGGRSGNRGGCAGPCRLPFEADALCLGQALNRGRLPQGTQADSGAPLQTARGAHHLSLKDMSHIAQLPQLAGAGVASVKIEGRLRSPEYAAAAVNACVQALSGSVYDAKLLRDVFSRSGFTNSYLDGKLDGAMFGVRTGDDAAAARAAAPQLRELFRRERPSVEITLQAQIEKEGAMLTVTDAQGNCVIAHSGAIQPQPAQKDQTENVQKALAKTGGTPFFAQQPAQVSGGLWFLPASEWNEMRRGALAALLQKRGSVVPHACLPLAAPQVQAVLAGRAVGVVAVADATGDVAGAASAVDGIGDVADAANAFRTMGASVAGARGPAHSLFVQFEAIEQMPSAWADMASVADATGVLPVGIVLPLAQWRQVPQTLRARTWLALPRWLAGAQAEDAVRLQVRESAQDRLAQPQPDGQSAQATQDSQDADAASDGQLSSRLQAVAFAGYFVQNLAHVQICAGQRMFGGFGLNVTNALSAQSYAELGLCGMTLSPELLATDMARIAPVVVAQTAALDSGSSRGAARLDSSPFAAQTAALLYGHLPLMLTRACPLQNTRSCKGCTREGLLLDRKGKYFPVRCTAPAAAGVRTVYNPIPIYMGDKLRELPVEIALVQFTVETPQQVQQVLACVQAGRPFPDEFTRGLYFKGTN